MSRTASFPLILRRAFRCLGLVDALVPLAFAMLYGLFASGIPYLGRIIGLALLVAYPLYLLEALRAWSRGGPEMGRALNLFTVMSASRVLAILAPGYLIFHFLGGPGAGYQAAVLTALLLFWLPASILVLALGDSLVEALNPVMVIRAIASMGGDYLRVWLFDSVLMIAALELGLRAPSPLDLYLVLLAATVSAAVLGAAAFGRRDSLRQEVNVNAEMAEIGPQEETGEHEFLRRFRQLRRDQGDEAALEWLEGELDQFYAPPEVHGASLSLAAELGRSDLVVHRGGRMIANALEDDRPDDALRAATVCVSAIPGFCLGDLEMDDKLIGLAERRGRHDLLLALCRNFNARFPRYRRSVDHAITASRLLIERYGQPGQARELLEDAVARGAEGEQLETIQDLLRGLDRV